MVATYINLYFCRCSSPNSTQDRHLWLKTSCNAGLHIYINFWFHHIRSQACIYCMCYFGLALDSLHHRMYKYFYYSLNMIVYILYINMWMDLLCSSLDLHKILYCSECMVLCNLCIFTEILVCKMVGIICRLWCCY